MNYEAPNGFHHNEIVKVLNLYTNKWEEFRVSGSERPHLTRTDSRSEEYNQARGQYAYPSYQDYIIHVRQLANCSKDIGFAIWDSVDELIEGLESGNYYIG